LVTYYQTAIAQPYGHLIIDLKPDTPSQCRIHMNIFDTNVRKQASTLHAETAPILDDAPAYNPSHTYNSTPVEPIDPMADKSTCWSCGISFQSPVFLTQHQNRGCGGGDDSDCSDDENMAWDDIVDQAYDKHDETFGEKASSLIDGGMSEKEARTQVADELMPKYVRSLSQMYGKFVRQLCSFNKNATHLELMKSIAYYMKTRACNLERAIKLALRKKRHLFQDVLNGFDDETDDSDEDESSDDTEEEDEEET